MDNQITLSRVEVSGVVPPAPTTPAMQPDRCCMGSLAMAYVPMQQWQSIYEPDVAFARGTLFAELDKPFIGEEVRFA